MDLLWLNKNHSIFIDLRKRLFMGNPAARVTDMHLCPMVSPGPVPHVGGPITGPGVPSVLIGGIPAAVMGNTCTCAGPPDTIVLGSTGVFIGGKPAARMGDPCAHGGTIATGLPTVLIGEANGGVSGGVAALPVHVLMELMKDLPPALHKELAQIIFHKQAAAAGDAFVHADGPCPCCGEQH